MIATLLLAPLTVPGIALGLAIYVALVAIDEQFGSAVTGSMVGLVLAHIMITTPWVVRLCLASLTNHDRAAEEAAASLGAGPLMVIWRVTLPAMRSGIIAAALFAFVISFENLELALFLTGPGVTTLPVAVLQYLDTTSIRWSPRSRWRRSSWWRTAAGAGSLRPAGPDGAMTPRHLRSTISASSSARRPPWMRSTLDVQHGELIVLLGPSGCGKTTTLRMIAGFVPPSAGDIRLDGASITALPPHRREMGIVFQSYALFPHLTVARNVAFGLEMRRMAADAAQTRAWPRCCGW